MELKSTVTSKGQITLPKTIRDIMELTMGDQVKFIIQEGKKILMEKRDNSVQTKIVNNIVEVLTKEQSLVIIKGGSGYGKRYFLKNFLIKNFRNDKVTILNPSEQGYDLVQREINSNWIGLKVSGESEDVLEEVLKTNCDILVVDTSEKINIETLCELSKSIKEMVLVVQDISEEHLLQLGSHLSITFSREGQKVEVFELSNETFKVKPYYI